MRRLILLALSIATLLTFAAACGSAEPVIVEVEKQVVVEKEVIREVPVEVVVEKEVIREVPVEVVVEKEVVKTVEVEKQVVVEKEVIKTVEVEKILEPFRIGVMESLTGPGETYGQVATQAKQLAMEEINRAGGINGRLLQMIIEDEKCNARDSITAYTKLTQVDNVKIILGTSCSGAMLGAAPLAEKDGVVMFSGLATNPAVADAGDYIFRTSMNDAQVGIDTGNKLWTDGIRKLATITEATDYAEGVRRETADRFKALGGEIVAEERYGSEETDFRTALTRIMGKNPDAIHIAAQAEFSGGTIQKQVRELGYEGPIYGEVAALGTTALDIAGDAATGSIGIVADLDPNNALAMNFLDRFRARYAFTTLEWYMGSAYDDVYITAACLAQTNDDQDADGFRDCLYNMEAYDGTIGTYTFDDRGEVVGLSNVVIEVLPLAERNSDNSGWNVLGPAPILP